MNASARRGATWERAWKLLDPASARLDARTRAVALAAKGFLAEAEGQALYQLASEASASAPCLEVGSYCGKSSLFLAAGCRSAGVHPLFAVDHHQGSEEQQPGQQYFDAELFDSRRGRVDTLGAFLDNIRRAELEEWVIPLVARSRLASRHWPGRMLSLVFIDGGHSDEDVRADVEGWARWVASGGYFCMHDLYPDPAQGGQAPYRAYQRLRASGDWLDAGQVETLGILKRR